MPESLTIHQDAVLRVLGSAQGALTRDEIYSRADEFQSPADVSWALSSLRKQSRVCRTPDDGWAIEPEQPEVDDDDADESSDRSTPETKPKINGTDDLSISETQRCIDYVEKHGPVTAREVKDALADGYASDRLRHAEKRGVLVREKDDKSHWRYRVPDANEDNTSAAKPKPEQKAKPEPKHEREPEPRTATEQNAAGVSVNNSAPEHAPDNSPPESPHIEREASVGAAALWSNGRLTIDANIGSQTLRLNFDFQTSAQLLDYLERLDLAWEFTRGQQ